MITLSKYGVILSQLTQEKIELLRVWRNHPKISQFMEYREEITPEMQQRWFNKISKDNTNLYFIICVDGRDVGCINIRDINYEKKCAEPGIFIWDDDYLESDLSYRAMFCLMDYSFYDLNLDYMIAHVLSDNKRAIKFNKSYGYVLTDNQDGIYNQEYILKKEKYESKRNRIVTLFV